MKRVRLQKDSRSMTADGIENVMSGMGTGKDKMAFAQFAAIVGMDKVQAEYAYRGDWIARKIIDIPAFDATREWRAWQADSTDITAIEQLEQTLNVQRKLMLAMQRGRLYGGGALILGINQGRPEDEVNLNAIKKGDLKFVHVVSRFDISAGQIEDDITSPYFGEPQYYDRTGKSGTVRLHPSRVVRMLGAEYPDPMTSDGWSDSILQVCKDAILAAGTTTGGVANMVNEAQVDVISVPNLTANLVSPAYEANLKKRFGIAATMKSIYNMLLLDSAEEWQRITSNFASLPDVLRMYLLIVSGAADIPATRMLGQSPAGLSATGESDTRNYYDRVATEQKTEVTPAMARLDEVLIRSALGTRPPELFYTWNSLWQLTDEQKADLAKKKAEVFQIDVQSGVMDPTVMKEARENQLIEDGTYPGLEQIIDEADLVAAALTPEPTGTDPTANEGATALDKMAKRIRDAKPGKGKAKRVRLNTTDATPRTLYVNRPVLNAADIRKHFKAQGFGDMVPAKEMHVTIAYSLEPVDWMKAGEAYGQDAKGNVTVAPGGVRIVEKFGAAVVLAFSSRELTWRHVDIKDRTGATWQWDDYQPHITLTYDGLDLNLAGLEPYRGEIVLGPEVFEEIKGDFKETLVEDAMWKKA